MFPVSTEERPWRGGAVDVMWNSVMSRATTVADSAELLVSFGMNIYH